MKKLWHDKAWAEYSEWQTRDKKTLKRPVGEGEVLEWRSEGVEELTHPLTTLNSSTCPFPFSGL